MESSEDGTDCTFGDADRLLLLLLCLLAATAAGTARRRFTGARRRRLPAARLAASPAVVRATAGRRDGRGRCRRGRLGRDGSGLLAGRDGYGGARLRERRVVGDPGHNLTVLVVEVGVDT